MKQAIEKLIKQWEKEIADLEKYAEEVGYMSETTRVAAVSQSNAILGCMQELQKAYDKTSNKSVEFCVYCKEQPKSSGSDYCGKCIDKGRYTKQN